MSHHPRDDSFQDGQIRTDSHHRWNWDSLFHLVTQFVVGVAAQSKDMDLFANLVPGTVDRE